MKKIVKKIIYNINIKYSNKIGLKKKKMEKLVLYNNFKIKGGYMVLVFFLGIIIIILFLLIIFLVFSNLQIEIDNFELSNIKNSLNNKKHINNKYEVILSLIFLNKIKWISFHLNSLKIRKMYTKMHLERIDIKELEKNISISDIKEIIKIKPNITKLNLNINIGVDHIILTSYLIPIICTVISIILSKTVRKEDFKKIKYVIDPIYNKGNAYHINLTTVINIKVKNVLKAFINIYKDRKQNNKYFNKTEKTDINNRINSKNFKQNKTNKINYSV